MVSAVLLIVTSRVLLYSVGSEVNRVQVVLFGFNERLLCFVQANFLCRLRYGCMYFLAALVCVDLIVMLGWAVQNVRSEWIRRLGVDVGPGFVSTSPAFMRSSASHPERGYRHNLHNGIPEHCKSSTVIRLCRLEP